MINAILKGIFKLITGLVSLILSPIDSAINAVLPSLSTGISYVSTFFNYIIQFIGFVVSWFNPPQWFITLVVGYWTFKLTLPFLIHTIKLALSWYDKLKP